MTLTYIATHDHAASLGMIEHNVFVRSRHIGDSAGAEAESSVVFSSAKSQSEIYCICVNSLNPSQIVVGTSKGILELTCDDTSHSGGGNGLEGSSFK